MKITLLRHTAVEEKYQGCYNGQIDISLCKDGIAHAKEIGLKLQKYNFDAIFCSDLKRTKETLQALNIFIKPTYTKLLREKSFGIHEGLAFEEINKTIKYKNFNQWLNDLDGERVDELKARVEEFFFKVLPKSSAKNVLIVTHAGIIKMLVSITEDISLEDAFALPFGYGNFITVDSDSYRF